MGAMSFIDPRNIAFWLYDWLGADALTGHPAYEDHSRETFDAILELAEKLAADRFASHYKASDRIEPALENGIVRVLPEIKQAIAAYAEAGLFAASFDPQHGGLGLPHVVDTAAMAHFMAANVATAAFPMLTAGNARVLVKFGAPAQIETFALPEIEGRTLGTMNRVMPAVPGGILPSASGIFASTRWTMFSVMSWSPPEIHILLPVRR